MRKIFLLIVFSIIIFPGCSREVKNPSISEGVVAKSIDKNTSMPIEASSRFSQSDTAIYFSIKVQDMPKNTNIKAVWKYLGDGTEISSEITTKGSGYEVFILKRSSNLFPAGEYKVTATAQVEGKTLEVSRKFSIAEEAKPLHLLNPVTSKSVDNDENLNPVDITSEFSLTDPVIYFIVQSKDLPKNSRIFCMWYYLDSGDVLTHELVSDGSRNLAFTLKPEDGKTLPSGKYIATATVTINGETESVSSEFTIQDLGK